jgi:hypothetical protein
MPPLSDDTVLLFYAGPSETDRWVKGDRYLKPLVRPVYRAVTGRQKVSGFQVAFEGVVRALRRRGLDVRVNDRALARRHPEHPVGVAGYPQILDGWRLPNPAVLGPGLLDHPSLAPRLMDDPRFRSYIVPCGWMDEMFRPYYGGKVVLWFSGLDTSEWRDTREQEKTTDVLVYDKIRWDRDRLVPELLDPALAAMERRGLKVEVLRYRFHDHAAYHAALGRSRGMLFLCEHETQGLAYQEAMASNVPILAWDNGFWLDPNRPRWEEHPVPASSVPYFAPECGEKFRDMGDFEPALDRFVAGLDRYTPRDYVTRELSLERSADLYMRHYRAAAARAPVAAGA